jgi:hypothetical protein
MKNLHICCLAILLLFAIHSCTALTDLEYRLGKSKYGSATISQDGLHGPNSARLNVGEGGSSIKVIVYTGNQMDLDELEYFGLWTKPIEGDGKIKIDLYLDGDGDGIWSSKSPADEKLYARSDSWMENGWPMNEWTEFDASSMLYKRTKYTDLGEKNLSDWREYLGPIVVSKIYISLYKYNSTSSTSCFDYLTIGDQKLSFEPLEDESTKKAKQKSVSPGGKITYTITYGNDLMQEITNLVVVENYDPRTIFLEADPPPDPGTNNVWTIGTLQPGQHGQIIIQMKSMKQKCEADITGNVVGNGFVSIRRKLSTERTGYQLSNQAFVSCDQFNISETATIAVKSIDETSITFSEHGAGNFSSAEDLRYTPTKISLQRELYADRAETIVNLSTGQPLVYNASWYASHLCENFKTETMLHERYLYGEQLDSIGMAEVQSTRSAMETESNFTGLAEYEIHWKETNLMDVLTGNFTVKTSVEEKKTTSRR